MTTCLGGEWDAAPMERAVFAKVAATTVSPACLPVVIPHTSPDLTAAALRSVQPLVTGLEAAVTLMAVQVVPYPLFLDRPDVDPGRLAADLDDLASACDFPVRVVIVVARERTSALQQAIPKGTLVVIPTRPRRWWRTTEKRLAGALRRNGHTVTLLSLEREA